MEGLTSNIYNVVEGILSILPDSPFAFIVDLGNTPVAQWLKWVNWFVPVYMFIPILEAWLSAIAIYYVYQLVLRWAKAIQ